MLPLLLFACLTSQTEAQNPGLVFSRGYNDMAALIKKNTPGLFTNFAVTSVGSLSFTSRDFITQVTIKMTDLIMKDFVVQSSNLAVSFNPSMNSIGIKVSNLTCSIYYNYTEVGFNINDKGNAVTTFTNSSMIINVILFYENGHLNYKPDYNNYTLKVVNSATTSKTMTRSLAALASSNMKNYWNMPENQEPIVLQMVSSLDPYVESLNYNYTVPGTSIYLEGQLASNNITVSDSYVSNLLNGTFTVKGGEEYKDLPQPINLPMRFEKNEYTGLTQVIVSNYTLATYFSAVNDYFGAVEFDSLPAGYPNFLSTNNGYFPQLLGTYGNIPLYLGIALYGQPQVFVMNRGILIRMTVSPSIYIMETGNLKSMGEYLYTFDYTCTPIIKGLIIYGTCFRPRSVKLQVQKDKGLSTFSVEKFLSDLIQYSFYAGDTNYYFPTVPLGYPDGSNITSHFVDYFQNYFVVSYMPSVKV